MTKGIPKDPLPHGQIWRDTEGIPQKRNCLKLYFIFLQIVCNKND